MRVAVISCWKYRDAWEAFQKLFSKFWPERRRPDDVIADSAFKSGGLHSEREIMTTFGANPWVFAKDTSWCESLASYALRCDSDAVMVFQEDFFLNAPVRQELIDHALEQLKSRNAGMIRLYPCPGADEDYGDPHYGIVKKGSKYRISCQASIWRPDYLHAIASQCGSTPRDFELNGTKIAESLPDEVLAFKRESGEWPLSYFCSAVSAGKWNPQALEFCRQQGISVDLSLREIA